MTVHDDDPLETSLRRAARKVLVIGDVMLDRLVSGIVERTSPEAPVAVLRADRTEQQPGGAAAVAYFLRGLELDVDVRLAGVVGVDRGADNLRQTLHSAGISTDLLRVDPSRPTTVKERLVGQAVGRHTQQLLRVDYESTAELSTKTSDELWSDIEPQIAESGAVLVSDYAKGVCTPELLSRVTAACHRAEVPLIIDPARRMDFGKYRGANLIKPNRQWLEEVLGRRINSVPDARQAIIELRNLSGWQSEQLLCTLDRDGMLLCKSNHEPRHLFTQKRHVLDVTGAGDLVQAVLGACITRGLPWQSAAEFAVTAAGLEVERRGISPVTWQEIESARQPQVILGNKILSRAELRLFVKAARGQEQRMVFTNGCFDLLHPGHLRLIQQAAAIGDVLIVAINSDASVKRCKGISRPFIPQAQRAEMIAALGCVHAVVIFEEDTPFALLQELQPDVLVKGAEYASEEVVGREVVTSYGGTVVTVPMLPGCSTTRLAQECAQSNMAGTLFTSVARNSSPKLISKYEPASPSGVPESYVSVG